MAQPRFSIGIDLGTSNTSLAYAPLSGSGGSGVLAIAQWETASTMMDSVIVPSFLYLNDGEWIVGRLAQRKISEAPGRVVKSAKSWLCHHAADRLAPFLPLGSEVLTQAEKISPVMASALVLKHLRAAWDATQDDPFDDQDITITVPASFDAVAQGLTLAAAREGGFPERTRLLEEPQAAFSWWLEQHWADRNLGSSLHHVLVIDIGGGTTDFSLFELTLVDGVPKITRVAVSDHILLGGDNIDLAIAHLLEPRLLKDEDRLSAGQWDYLVASCRALKERVLGSEGVSDETFGVSIPGRGSGLFAGSLSAQLSRGELETLLLDGFFPDCKVNDRPARTSAAMKEWGLPYAFDGAITRHLAEFLRGRQRVDAVLFNGGSLSPLRLRNRLREQIRKWQGGDSPQVLDNIQLDLAVARGAAYFGRLLHRRANRIEAGAARAVFFEAHNFEAHNFEAHGGAAETAARLVCILPHGALSEESFELSDLDVHLRINKLVRFQIHTSTRHEASKVGDIVDLNGDEFQPLPPLETVATVTAGGELGSTIPVALISKVNELGLLQVSCRSLAPDIRQSWPLEFNLRPLESSAPTSITKTVQTQSNASPRSITEAGARINAVLMQPPAKGDKLTATRLFKNLEQSLGCSKGDWNGNLIRTLWSSLEECQASRSISVEHEETWLVLAGFFLRPGFGVALDDARIDTLWHIHDDGLKFPDKRVKLQDYILWRRVAGGLSRERQETLIAAERDRIFQAKNVSSELIRMVGSFERLGHDLKAELAGHFISTVVDLMAQKKHCAPYLSALGLILNRTPFYSGPESVMPPSLVELAYDKFSSFDWSDPEFAEVQTLFLRAARAIDDRRLDLPKSLRHQIAGRLEKCGVTAVKTGRLREAVPIERAERLSLYGEAVPPGLVLGGD